MCKYGFTSSNNAAVGGVYFLPDDSGKVRPMVLVSDPYHYGYSRVNRLMPITSQYHCEYLPIVFNNDNNGEVHFVNVNKMYNFSKSELSNIRAAKFMAREVVDVMKTLHAINIGMPIADTYLYNIIHYIFKYNDIRDNLKFYNENNGTKINELHLSDIAELSTLNLMIEGRILTVNDILDLTEVNSSRIEYLRSEIIRSCENKPAIGFISDNRIENVIEKVEENVIEKVEESVIEKVEEKEEEITEENKEDIIDNDSANDKTIVELESEIKHIERASSSVPLGSMINRPSSYDKSHEAFYYCSSDIRQKAIENVTEFIASNLPSRSPNKYIVSSEEINDTRDTITLWLDDNCNTALTRCMIGIADYHRIYKAIQNSGCKNMSYVPSLLNKEIRKLIDEQNNIEVGSEEEEFEDYLEPIKEPMKKKKKKSNIGPKKSYNKHQLRKAGYGCIGSMMSGRKLS